MRTLLSVLVLALALGPSVARAECAAPYPLPSLAKDLGLMQSSLRNLDEEGFRSAAERLKAGMPCMASPAPAQVYATAYRLLGAEYFLEGDTEQAEAWFRTAIELDRDFAWDVRDFDVSHPIRLSYEGQAWAAVTDPAVIEGQELHLPSGGRLIMDGKPLDTPAATPRRPHVIQQVGPNNTVVQTWVIEGNGFPAALLQPISDEPEAPAATLVIDDKPAKDKKKKKEKKPKEPRGGGEVDVTQASATVSTSGNPMDDVVVVQRVRPAMKTPLLLLGGAGLLGAGGTYAASYLMHQRFEEAGTSDDANQLRSTTNALVIASGGIAVLGVGLGYWGVLLDGGVGLAYHRNF